MNLKPQDVIYFDKLQRDYENTINYYNDLAEHMESWRGSLKNNEHFMNEGSLDNDIKNVKSRNKNKVTEQFTLNICNYFEKNYGISTLTNNIVNKIIENYVEYNFIDYQGKNDNLHYSEVIKYICEELKITDFNSREIDDLRKRINDRLKYHWECNRITIGNNKIKITDYGFGVDNDIWSKKTCLNDDTVKVFKDMASAYNYLTNGQPKPSEEFLKWLSSMNNWQERIPIDEFYKSHEINLNGLKSLRFYKNRSLEIKMSAKLFNDRLIRVLKGDF